MGIGVLLGGGMGMGEDKCVFDACGGERGAFVLPLPLGGPGGSYGIGRRARGLDRQQRL